MIPDLANLPLRPTDIRDAVSRYRVPAVFLFVVVLGAACGGSLFLPKTYYSEAKFLVKNGRENLVLDPTAGTGQVIPQNESREGEINSLVEIFRNRQLLDRIVERIGADSILTGDSPLKRWVKDILPPALKQKLEEAQPDDTTSALGDHFNKRHYLAIQELEKNVNIHSPRRSNVISVVVKAKSPELAQQLANELTTELVREHQRVHSTSKSFEFFTQEVKQQEERVANIRDQLRKAKDQHQIVTLDGKRASLQGRISELELRKANAQADFAQSESRIQSLEKLLKEFPDHEIASETGVANPGAFAMENTLFQYKLSAIDQLAKFSDDHPLAQAARQRLSDGQDALAAVDPVYLQSTKAVHPLKQKLRGDLAAEKSQLETIRTRLVSLETLIAAANTDLHQLNRFEIEVAQLQQKVELADVSLRQANEKLEQARVNHELEGEQFSNLRLVQPASYNIKPNGVSKTAVCLLGLILACTGSVGLPMGLACMNPQLRTRNDLERALGVPVLAGIVRPRSVFHGVNQFCAT